MGILLDLKALLTKMLQTSSVVGEIKAYAGSTVPNGWLICDGSAISRTDYPLLFNAIGTLWGVGDGSTTFNLPNLKGKVPVGYDSSQTEFDTVGESGGAKTVTLNVNQIPSHAHAISNWTQLKVYATGTGKYAAGYQSGASTGTTAAGGGQAHNNLQPYAVVKYIICAI